MTANLAETAASLHPSVVHVFGDLRGRIDGDLLALQFTTDGSLVAVEEGGVFRRWDDARRSAHRMRRVAQEPRFA